MRLTRAAPARPTSNCTWPMLRRVAPLTGASNASTAPRLGAALPRFRTTVRLALRVPPFLLFARAAFFLAIEPGCYHVHAEVSFSVVSRWRSDVTPVVDRDSRGPGSCRQRARAVESHRHGD